MEYLAAVDEKWRFLAHRSLTPLEWGFAEALELAGIPLAAVLEGLCRSFDHYRPRPGAPRIRSFIYCMGIIVDTAVELYPDTHWQARRSAPSADQLEREKGSIVTPPASVPVTPATE